MHELSTHTFLWSHVLAVRWLGYDTRSIDCRLIILEGLASPIVVGFSAAQVCLSTYNLSWYVYFTIVLRASWCPPSDSPFVRMTCPCFFFLKTIRKVFCCHLFWAGVCFAFPTAPYYSLSEQRLHLSVKMSLLPVGNIRYSSSPLVIKLYLSSITNKQWSRKNWN